MVLIQKDMGSAVVFFFMFLVMSFTAGVKLRWFAAIFALLAVALPLAWNYGLIREYQKTRLTSFLHLEDDPTGTGWQQIQGRISIGSGQMFGGDSARRRACKKVSSPFRKAITSFPLRQKALGLWAVACSCSCCLRCCFARCTWRGVRRTPSVPLSAWILCHDFNSNHYQPRHVPELASRYGCHAPVFQCRRIVKRLFIFWLWSRRMCGHALLQRKRILFASTAAVHFPPLPPTELSNQEN